ncbi:MAG: hypothetical protein E4H01_11545 [Lysobacterales bacterium]|nr:MAG: hypothetical protein E4H01_11545 [Xanthomonadales bacterium]
METFTLSFTTENAAFDQLRLHEVARVLRDVADNCEARDVESSHSSPVFDINGNRIGEWQITSDDSDDDE